eukprot:gene30238-34131_t
MRCAPRARAFNLGTHVGDDAADVQANRAVLQRALGVRPVFLEQVHGTQVQTLDMATADGTQADACQTRAHGVACTIMVADCLPVLFAHSQGRAVGAAHAGWRGLAGEGGRGCVESGPGQATFLPGEKKSDPQPPPRGGLLKHQLMH